MHISIIGSGTMGISIGLSFALKNYITIIYSLSEIEIDAAKKMLGKHFNSLIENQYIIEKTAINIQSSIIFTTLLIDVVHH